jgi:hypothetical protein
MKCIIIIVCVVQLYYSKAQVPLNGLIGGWPFTGNAQDMSGLGNHGMVSGATLIADRFGNSNAAYHFNGSSDFIQMLSAGPAGDASRSVSFWARTNNTLIQVGFGYGDASGPGGIFQIVFNYNCFGVGFDNSQAALIRGYSSVNNNSWHHIVAVFNSSISTQIGDVAIYVDGVAQTALVCKVSNTTSTIFSNTNFPIIIGKSSNSNLRYFEGELDDFYFYSRPLSIAEIDQLYTGISERNPDFLYYIENPSTGIIKINPLMHKFRIELYDVSGMLIREYKSLADNLEIDFSDVDAGVYAVRFCSPQANYMKKLVKQ